MNTGIDHATCIATARSSVSRAVRAHYLNLAAFWRFSYFGHGSMVRNPLASQAATSTFSRSTGQLPRLVVIAASLLLPFAAQAAEPPAKKQAPCQNVRFADGTTDRVRVSESGNWSRCEYSFEIRIKAGAGRKPIELRTVHADRCYAWVSEQALAKDKGLIEKAWSLCVDASHAEAEKQPTVRK